MSYNITLTIENEELITQLGDKLDGVIAKFLEQTGYRGAELMIQFAPKVTGALALSIGYQVSERQVVIGPQAAHGLVVELGARPHDIRPRFAQALAFVVGGPISFGPVQSAALLRFAKRVQHPGVVGRFYVKNTKEQLERGLQAELQQRLQEGLAK